MSVSQIPNLTSATALNGSEQLEAVQAGSSVKVTTSQIATYVQATYTPSTITSVTANSPLTSSTVSGAVTINLPSQSITNAYLATMTNGTVKANLSGSTSTPTDVTPSAILDTFGTQTGTMIYRGASSWTALTAGTNAQVLTSNGTTSAPSWQTLSVPSGNIAPTGVSAGTYGSASLVPQFTVLASGQLSVATNVAILIPSAQVSGLGTMATQNASAVVITGGTVNGTTIGATTPSTGAFTAFSASGNAGFATITSGTWNGTTIGVTYGGTGATTAAGARTNLGAAASGANSDITSLSGLTTPLSAPQGGTGFSSYTTGDLLYADTSSTLARLNDVATGNALISGGVGVAPSWGKIALTTHVSGTLPVANGGTGATTLTGYLYGNGTGAFTASATIPNAGLTYSTITIGSTAISLGGTSATLAGLTTVTLTQDPTLALQASTKQYVDGQVAAVSNTTFHTASGYATTAALSATYSNGTAGVGATLTNSIALAALTIDGYTFTATDVTNSTRVLVKDQSSGLQNGIYTVTNQGSALVAWVLTRATDFDTVGTGPNYIETGASTFVAGGAVNGATSWVMNTSGTITVGTTALTWTQTSSSSSVTVTSPLTKVGSVISLGTVPTTLGGTGLTTLTAYNVMLGNGTGNVAFAAPSTTGYPLLSTGAASNPSFGQLSLTAGVTGTLPVANGGTGTATAFTTGSVVFAGTSGTYTQDNAKFFWDDTNNRLGINTATPQVQLTILSNTQTTTPTGTLPSGTDLYIVGANAANTRITQDAYGTGAYPAYTGRMARGTAAAPTATQLDDILVEVTGRGYGATGFGSSSTVRIDLEAAEAFTDTAQGTYISFHTSALGAASAVERYRIGPSGQWGIGGATYGTSGYSFVSGGASAAPSWSQISLTAGVTGTLPVANGGTGLATTPANGALLIGNGTNYTSATLTAGTNIAITNGSGSISIATSATPSFATSITTPIVYGGTTASSSLTLQSTSGVGTSDSILFKVGNNGATTAMTVDTSGNVGIGTTSSSERLRVTATGLTEIRVNSQTSGDARVGFWAEGAAYNYIQTVRSSGALGMYGDILTFNRVTGLTESMRIDSSGLVGIATAGATAYGSLTVGQSGQPAGGEPSSRPNIEIWQGSPSINDAGGIDLRGSSSGSGYGWRMSAIDSAGLHFVIGNRSNSTTYTERVRIDSSGNVGIGGTPSTKLTLFGTQTIRGNGTDAGIFTCLYMDESISPYTSVLAGYTLSLNTGGNSARTARIYVDQNGNVGIGTGTTPASTKLEVAGNVSAQQSNGRYFGFGVGGFSFDGTTVNDYGITYTTISSTYNTVLAAFSNIKFATSQQERMRIDTSGNVTVGTTSAGNTLRYLDLQNSDTGSSAGSILRFITSNVAASGLTTVDLVKYKTGGFYINNNDTDAAVFTAFNVGASERMRIDNSGNLLVGTTSNYTATCRTFIKGSSASGSDQALVVGNSSGTYMFVARNDGYVALPSVYSITNAAAANVYIDSSGYLYRSTSSLKYKRDVEDAAHGLAEVMQLRPVVYKGNSKENGETIFGGLIAEEVHDVGLTEFVQYAEDGSPDALAYGNMVSLCIKAIQELSAKNDALEARLAKLETVQ